MEYIGSYPVPGRFTSPPLRQAPRKRQYCQILQNPAKSCKNLQNSAKSCQILAASVPTAASVFRSVFRPLQSRPLDPPDARNTINTNCFLMICKSALSGLWPILGPKWDPQNRTIWPFWVPGEPLDPPRGPFGRSGTPPGPFSVARGPSEHRFGPWRPNICRFCAFFARVASKNDATPTNQPSSARFLASSCQFLASSLPVLRLTPAPSYAR